MATSGPATGTGTVATGTQATPVTATGTGTVTPATGTGTTAATGTGTVSSDAGTVPVPPPPQLPPQPAEPRMRVGLGRSQSTADIFAQGGLTVIANGAVQWKTQPGQIVRLSLQNDAIQVVGLPGSFPGPVRLVPQSADGPVSYGGKTYRGEIEVMIVPRTRRLSVINVLNLEEYLQGVVPAEMPASWPAEALKAQAVVARTFALSSLGRFADEGFDVLNTTGSQAYGGMQSEYRSTNAAVAATRGQVVTHSGRLATTYYFSSSGGHTENSEIIWTAILPYLRGVPDFDNLPGNLFYSWRVNFTVSEFSRKLTEYEKGVGEVRTVLPDGPVGPSGRPARWRVTGTAGNAVLTAEQMRWALGLRSSAKSIILRISGIANSIRTFGAGESFFVVTAGSKVVQRPIQGTVIRGAAATVVSAKQVTAMGPRVVQSGGVEAVGGGHGHGVGMSQWGAHGLALLGRNYQEILTHYYTGVKVETR